MVMFAVGCKSVGMEYLISSYLVIDLVKVPSFPAALPAFLAFLPVPPPLPPPPSLLPPTQRPLHALLPSLPRPRPLPRAPKPPNPRGQDSS